MAAVTGCTIQQFAPNNGLRCEVITTPATADSNDSIDVSSSTVTGGNTFGTIYYVLASDITTGDAVTCTWSSTTITLDASGGTTNHTYKVFVWGI
jgi:hypothetical protein